MNKLNLALILSLILFASSCKVGRFVFYNFADIKDYKKFPARNIEKPAESFSFAVAEKGKAPRKMKVNGEEVDFESYLEKNNTVAFMIIQNDTIQYENYWRGYTDSSIVPSFSMAKSVTSIMIGCAIDDGFIKSVDEPVSKYIPELEDFDSLTIEHLLQMTAGLEFKESYVNPFGEAASFYYGTKLRKGISKMKLDREPGTHFEYQSGSTQLLGLVLERAIKDQSITSYLEQKLWKPLQMEYDASWSLDRKKEGLEKTFCCINARARDYAKIGRLYLNDGQWNGQQIVSKEWVERSTKVDTANGSASYYQYQWWLPTPDGDFMAQGILGQFIYVNPEKNLIIVRLGKNEGKADWWQVLPAFGRVY